MAIAWLTNTTVTVQRIVQHKPFTFHDGLTLPVGTRMAIPNRAYLKDPTFFENPEDFDIYRFMKSQTALDNDKRTKSSSIEQKDFGNLL